MENHKQEQKEQGELTIFKARELLPSNIIHGSLVYYLHKKKAASNPNLLGALKSFPGMPREFSFQDLKKAINNFNKKYKLGQGGFGVVYKGVLLKENIQIAIKKFSRDNIKSQNDFLSELTIINCLCHKHLVRLLGHTELFYSKLFKNSYHSNRIYPVSTKNSVAAG
ncbi:unnamed protein product [Dovyalis caffra]|uniref:Protein kinase domain-containing protein n=1 Tax=Dovyalis caffra TaxID=77055 RepID=A0AAV1SU61_9ROSI|nr:unnamed protein product [Dovyalis caffra]